MTREIISSLTLLYSFLKILQNTWMNYVAEIIKCTSFFLIFIYFILCVSALTAYIHVYFMCGWCPQRSKETLSWNYGLLWTTLCVLESEHWCSTRPTSALNCKVIFPGPNILPLNKSNGSLRPPLRQTELIRFNLIANWNTINLMNSLRNWILFLK